MTLYELWTAYADRAGLLFNGAGAPGARPRLVGLVAAAALLGLLGLGALAVRWWTRLVRLECETRCVDGAQVRQYHRHGRRHGE